jgi:hypothetical protein
LVIAAACPVAGLALGASADVLVSAGLADHAICGRYRHRPDQQPVVAVSITV